MILVNLLPHRAEKRKRRKQAFFTMMGVSALGGAFVAFLGYGYLQQMVSNQQERNTFLTAEIAKLDEEIKDVQTLQAEIEALQARQKAVQDLQSDRNTPVHLLNELVKQLPDGIYLSSVKQEGQYVTLIGVAQSNERISELLHNTANKSDWLEKPELLESKASVIGVGSAQKRLFEFGIKLALKRPQTPADAASAAGDAASAASAPQS